MKKEKQVIVIDKVVLGGQGLARLKDGLVVLVPFVLPGETVEVAVSYRKKQHAKAELIRIVSQSPERVEPQCAYYTSCGGCDLQHATYPYQLALKSEYFSETLARSIPQDTFSAIQIEPVLGCSEEFNYRQRIRLQLDSLGQVGFYKKNSHDVIDIDSCPLAMAELNSVLSELKENFHRYSLLAHTTSIELLFSPAEAKVVVITNLSRKPRAADREAAIQLCSDIDLIKSVWLSAEGFAVSGPYLKESESPEQPEMSQKIGFSLSVSQAEKLSFCMEPGGFCQVNLSQNQSLVSLLLDWVAQIQPLKNALDLFCGMGNFSLPLAQNGLQVTGMDLQRSSIRSAKRNAEDNKIENCSFSRSDADSAIKKLVEGKVRFDLVLLDPPRQGCKNIISTLPLLDAKYIIYISCDPATLARDLCLLSDVGYAIIKSRGVDMFPQTHHIESISLLKRKEGK